jgi:hypothetical protein
MKVKKLMKELYKACIEGDTMRERVLWLKSIKKSLKGKKTQGIK